MQYRIIFDTARTHTYSTMTFVIWNTKCVWRKRITSGATICICVSPVLNEMLIIFDYETLALAEASIRVSCENDIWLYTTRPDDDQTDDDNDDCSYYYYAGILYYIIESWYSIREKNRPYMFNESCREIKRVKRISGHYNPKPKDRRSIYTYFFPEMLMCKYNRAHWWRSSVFIHCSLLIDAHHDKYSATLG